MANPPLVESPYLLSAKQAVDFIGRKVISYSHFKSLQAKRKTPATRLGRRCGYTREALIAWVKEISKRS